MTSPMVHVALSRHIIAVTEDMKPFELMESDPWREGYAVFSEGVAAAGAGFLGMVEVLEAERYPRRIFADLLPRRGCPRIRSDTPLHEVLVRLNLEQRGMAAVVDPDEQFVGAVSRLSLMEAVLNQKDGSIDVLRARIQELERGYCEAKDRNARLERFLVERSKALSETQGRLRTMARELTQAEQRERRRLSTDLHDYLAQLLSLCRMKVAHAQRHPQPNDLGQVLCSVDRLLEQSLAYTRSLLAELQPTVLYRAGLVAALRWLGEQMQVQGLSVCVDAEQEHPAVSEDVAMFVFQTVRELLHNVLKHAGVGMARVSLGLQSPARVTLVVSDAGRGFEPSAVFAPPGTSQQFGLLSIRERVQALGGELRIESSPGQGTRVTVCIPVTSPPPSSEP